MILSGVGGGDDSMMRRRRAKAVTSAAGLGQGATELNVLNWTEYIDLTGAARSGPSIASRTSRAPPVNYSETFNDNNEVYGKEFAAYLDAGNPTPWDIAVPTYWMAARLRATTGWHRCRST